MKEILAEIDHRHDQGKRVALATVVKGLGLGTARARLQDGRLFRRRDGRLGLGRLCRRRRHRRGRGGPRAR